MKKLALALMSASAAVFGFGIVASAQGYDPALVVDPASPDAGGAYTVTYENCFVGETITFTQLDSTPTSVTGECEPVNGAVLTSVIGLVAQQGPPLGAAVGAFAAAPTEPGVYSGTGAGGGIDTGAGFALSPSLPFQFEITGVTETTEEPTETTEAPVDTASSTTVAGGGTLPETGSTGIGTTTGIAIGLFAAGLGMFVVAQVRRRQEPSNI